MLVSTSIPGSNCTVNNMNGGLVVLMNMLGPGGTGGGGGYDRHHHQGSGERGCGITNSMVVGGNGCIGVEPVQATIWHCINNYAYADACFLAERVHAEAPSDETLHTLSTAYYRSGSKTKTYVLLSTSLLKTPNQMTPKNRYLLALVSYELEKYAEAESTLLKSLKQDGKSTSQIFEQIERVYGEIGAFALKLYALICVQTERSLQAFEAFSRCLKLNPFMWNAYEYVCRLGIAGNGGKNKENSGGGTVEDTAAGKRVRGQQTQRVFQLPDTNPPPPSSSIQQTSTTPTIPPSTYLPILIGSTAATLILQQSGPFKPPGYYDNAPNNNSFQNNQNYYQAKDSSLNYSNSSVFLNSASTGVLHPSNRNNIKPSKRNLFTSTPMGGGGMGIGGGGHGGNNNFGIIPLHLMMDSSSASTVSNPNASTTHHQVPSSINLTNNASPGVYSSPINPSSLAHSPVVGDFTDELVNQPGNTRSDYSTVERNVEPPRPKKPCLRTPWQQQVNSSASQPQSSQSNTPQNQLIQTHGGTVTISTSTNHTLRRSSRLFTHHHNHHHLKENNKMNPPLLQTPPSSNVNAPNTPDSSASSGGSTRRSGKGSKPHSSVLKPKLRLNNSGRGQGGGDVRGSTTSSTSTITGDIRGVEHLDGSPVIGKDGSGSSMLESSGEFFRCVMEKSGEEGVERGQGSVVGQGDVKERERNVKFEDRVGVAVEAFRNGVDPLLHILSNLSAPYTSQNAYNCCPAISQYQRLKPSQYETGWIHGNIARCYFELGNYEECIKSYKRMMEIEPWRTEGLEWLSTAYWHLQKETELSALAQDLMKSNRTNEVATWVAAGNCFSLHKEHETAIKFFKRAIQVNRGCAYAYTLLGHEYVVTEELEKAMRCFRSATRIDCSHYNAWYGMGMIFYKQERYERAEVYYRKALGIHPNNSVLLCHLGVVQHALGRAEKSLSTFTRALEANKNDPLCKFHRASVLFGIGKLDEALEELEELKEIVPKESLVYFLIAKIFSKKGDTHKALLHFSWATDLDPKGANNQIKESIEPVLSRVTNTTNALLTTVNSTAIEQSSQEEEEEEEDDEEDDEEEEEDDEEDEEEDDDDAAHRNNQAEFTTPSPREDANTQQRVITRNMRGSGGSNVNRNS